MFMHNKRLMYTVRVADSPRLVVHSTGDAADTVI
jgi:hypothetical protein